MCLTFSTVDKAFDLGLDIESYISILEIFDPENATWIKEYALLLDFVYPTLDFGIICRLFFVPKSET